MQQNLDNGQNDEQLSELLIVATFSVLAFTSLLTVYTCLRKRKSVWPVYFSRWELFLRHTQRRRQRRSESSSSSSSGPDEMYTMKSVESIVAHAAFSQPPAVSQVFELAFFSLSHLVFGPVVLGKEYVAWLNSRQELIESSSPSETAVSEIEMIENTRNFVPRRRRSSLVSLGTSKLVRKMRRFARKTADAGVYFPSVGLDGAAMLHFLKLSLLLSIGLLVINAGVLIPSFLTEKDRNNNDLDKLSVLSLASDNGRWWLFTFAAFSVVLVTSFGLRSFWSSYVIMQKLWMTRKLSGEDGPVTGLDLEALLSTRVALIRGLPARLRSAEALEHYLHTCIPWLRGSGRIQKIVVLHSANQVRHRLRALQAVAEDIVHKVRKHNRRQKRFRWCSRESDQEDSNLEFQTFEIRPLLNELSSLVDDFRIALEQEDDVFKESPHAQTVAILCSDMATATAIGNMWLSPESDQLLTHANVAARDIDWSQVDVPPVVNEKKRRTSNCLLAGVIVLWSFPVAFVLSWARLDRLTDTFGFLGFINDAPSAVRATVQSLLPVLSLTILLFIIKRSILMRLARRVSAIRHQQNTWAAEAFTSLLFVHGFLLFLVSVTFFNAFEEIEKDPSNLVDIFASNVPTAWRTMAFFVLVKTALLPLKLLRLKTLFQYLFLRALRKVAKRQNASQELGPPLPPVVSLMDDEGKGADWSQYTCPNMW
ncbi:MAG: hypothetical protein MHM6MM_003330 [Cercozoa sp. M6MM]